MGNNIQFFWDKLINIGFLDSMNEEERVQLKILNLQSIYCVIGCVLFLIKSLFESAQDVFAVFILTLILSMVLILNHFHKLTYAKVYWTVLLPLIIFGIVIMYGKKSHGEIQFIIPIVNIFILFERKRIQFILTSFVIVSCITALIYNVLYESPLESTIDITHNIGTFLITSLCIATIIVIYTNALRQQLQLSEINNQALQDANADLEHFTYMASHNMKTPLRNILGSIFFMKRKIPKAEMEIIEEHINDIKTSANDMHILIKDIMEYAVFVQNEMTNIEIIDLRELTENIIKSVNVSLNKNAVFQYLGHSEINSNLTLIKAILQNLIENGVKYNNNKTPIINVKVTKEKETFLMKIVDNGIGINEEYFDKIFVMFKRLHHNDEYEGTGIGLAMCKRLLNKYNGEIWLESEVGHGTTFFVRIPT